MAGVPQAIKESGAPEIIMNNFSIAPGQSVPFHIVYENTGNQVFTSTGLSNPDNNLQVSINVGSGASGEIIGVAASKGTTTVNFNSLRWDAGQTLDPGELLAITGNYKAAVSAPNGQTITSIAQAVEGQWSTTADSVLTDTVTVERPPLNMLVTNVWAEKPSLGLLSTTKVYATINNRTQQPYSTPVVINLKETLALGQIRSATATIGQATISGKTITVNATIGASQTQTITITYYTGLVLGSAVFTMVAPTVDHTGSLSATINIINLLKENLNGHNPGKNTATFGNRRRRRDLRRTIIGNHHNRGAIFG